VLQLFRRRLRIILRHGQNWASLQRLDFLARAERCGTVGDDHVPTRAALAAENLFLRKQLALYIERKAKPRRADDATRITLVRLELRILTPNRGFGNVARRLASVLR
jgi:hypothetical protein